MGGGYLPLAWFSRATPAVVSVHPLPAWPLVIDVSMIEPVALAKWQQQAIVHRTGWPRRRPRLRRAVCRHRPAVPPAGRAECQARGDGPGTARQRGPRKGLRRDVVRLAVGTRCGAPLELGIGQQVIAPDGNSAPQGHDAMECAGCDPNRSALVRASCRPGCTACVSRLPPPGSHAGRQDPPRQRQWQPGIRRDR